MHVCIVSKPKSEKNRKIEEKSFKGVSKTKKKKKTHEEIEFHNS